MEIGKGHGYHNLAPVSVMNLAFFIRERICITTTVKENGVKIVWTSISDAISRTNVHHVVDMWKLIFAKNIFRANSLFSRDTILSSSSYKREIIVSIRFPTNKT